HPGGRAARWRDRQHPLAARQRDHGYEGRYRLVLPAGSTGAVQLTARRIGYQTSTVPVNLTGASTQQDLSLVEGAIELQQVVVTALGIEREQRSLSYAAQTVSGERLSDVPTQNV